MATSRAVSLAPDVWRIPTAPFDLVNSFAFVEDDGSVTLVDCGLRRASRRIVDGLDAMGKHPRDVTRILLTHAHNDHAGGAAHLVGITAVDGVTAHSDDASFLRWGQAPPRDARTTGGRVVARLPGGGFPPVAVAEEIVDGQKLDVAGGLRVVHTPGHTPGHVSLLHEPSQVLITGDAVWNMGRRMTWPVRALCTDVHLMYDTADRLGDLPFTLAAFTHGPELRERARERLRDFLARAKRV